LFGTLAACAAPPDPPAADGGNASPDAGTADATAADHGGSDASATDSAFATDSSVADGLVADAASEDAAFNRCAYDFDRVTLRVVNERRWLRPGAAAISVATSSVQTLVEATVDHGTAAIRALAAGSSQISMTSSSGTSHATIEVDLGDSVFATAVVAISYGTGAGFGQQNMPTVVLGPPRGSGAAAGSLDVVSLGLGGSITVELGVDVVDGPGSDLIVFENPFVGFLETGQVAVSADGQTFVAFACDPATQVGCAGVNPVKASPDNGTDPTDPTAAGGDAFDLATISMTRAHFVRITDLGGVDTGGGKAGFDLDAVVAIHSVPHGAADLSAPAPLALAVGAIRSPRFDVVAGQRTQYAVPVACSVEPTGLAEVQCGCSLTGMMAGSGTVTARFGDMTQQLALTVGE